MDFREPHGPNLSIDGVRIVRSPPLKTELAERSKPLDRPKS
jgi:hypothetical protein